MTLLIGNDWVKPALAVQLQIESEAGRECCGLMLGKENHFNGILPLVNASAYPSREFAFDPSEQVKAFEKYSDSIIGVYHSHIRGEAYPSLTDIHLAVYPNYYYLIMTREELRAFRIIDGFVNEEEVSYSDSVSDGVG